MLPRLLAWQMRIPSEHLCDRCYFGRVNSYPVHYKKLKALDFEIKKKNCRILPCCHKCATDSFNFLDGCKLGPTQ